MLPEMALLTTPELTLHKATVTVNEVGDIIHVKAGIYIEIEQCVLSVGVSIEGEGDVSVIKSVLTNPFIETLRLSSDEEGIDGNQHISNLKIRRTKSIFLHGYCCKWKK